jgi:hypothetical protein
MIEVKGSSYESTVFPTPANDQLVYGFDIQPIENTTHGFLGTIWPPCSPLPMQENLDAQVAIAQSQAVFDWTHLLVSAKSFPMIAN